MQLFATYSRCGSYGQESNKMISFSSIKRISVLWAHDGASWQYNAIPDSIEASPTSESVRFELREIDGQDHDLEVVIQQKVDDSYVFKIDYYDDPEREYPLRLFAADDELLFYFNGKDGSAYFHLAV